MRTRQDLRFFWQRDGVFLLLLLLIFVSRYLPPFLRGDLFGPFQDNIWIYGPIFSRAAEIAKHGSYPLWLDTMLTGFPLFDTPHFSTTYPFYFFGWLNYGIELDSVRTLTQLTFLHLFILCFNSYIMIRLAGAGGFGALCGATVALLSGSTTAATTWITIIASYSWLPLLIGSAFWIVRQPSLGGALLLVMSASLLILASPAQPLIHAFLFCICFFACALWWCAKSCGKAHTVKLIVLLILALGFVAGITAVATVPVAIDTAGMIRHVGARTAVVGHQHIPWKAFTSHQLEPAQIWNVFANSQPLGIIGGPYIGTAGLAGIVLAWANVGDYDRFRRFLLIFSSLFAIYGLLAGLGTHTGITQLHFYLPLLNRIREAGRHLVWFTIFSSLLAGFGFDYLSRHFRRSLTFSALGTMIGILWIIELIIAIRAGGCNWLPVCVIPLALLAFRFSGLKITKGIAAGLIFLCIAASIARNGSAPQRVSQYYTPSNLTAFRIIRQLTALPDVYSSRVAFRDSALAPGNWAMDASFYGLRSFYMNMTPVPHDQFLDMNRESLPNYRELMGARYLVCGKAAPPRSANDRLLFSDGDYRVYELDRWMPSAILVHNLAGSYSGREQFFEKIRRGYDFNRIAYVPADNYDRVNEFMHHEYGGATIPDSLKITKRSSNERVFRSKTSTPALLILNEYYNKAWHVRVNDRKESLLRVNLNQLGLLLRPGDNIVRFEYKPLLFEWLLLTQRAMAVVFALFAGIRGCLFF